MNKGFTLVELLVAIAMFTLIIVAVISAFLAYIQKQANTQEERSNLEQISFAADLINRDFRLSRESHGCGERNPMNNRCICISLDDQLGRKIGYRIKDTKIEKTINFSTSCSDSAGWVRITNENVDFTKSYFEVANSRNTQSILRTKFFGQYKVGTEDKTIELNSQASKRLLDFSNEAISNLSVASNVSKLGSSLDLDLYFNDAGKCVPNFTSEGNFKVFDLDLDLGDSLCEKKLVLKNANILNTSNTSSLTKPIYYITENGFLFHGDVELKRNIKRVLGLNGCRGCKSDPLNVAYVGEVNKINPDSYLVTKDNKFSYIEGSMSERTAKQEPNVKRIYKIDGPLVLFTDKRNDRVFRYLESSMDLKLRAGPPNCLRTDVTSDGCYDIITSLTLTAPAPFLRVNSPITVFDIKDFKYIEDEHIFIEVNSGGYRAFGLNDRNEFIEWGELPNDFTLNVGVIGSGGNKKFIYLSTEGKLKTFDRIGASPPIERFSNFDSLFPALLNANPSIIENVTFCEPRGTIRFKPSFPFNDVLIGESENTAGQTLREVYHFSTVALTEEPCNSDAGIDTFATERRRIIIPHALIEGIEEDYGIYLHRIVNLELKDRP